jgi:predicted ATPase
VVRDHPLKAVKQELQLHGHCAEVPLEYLNAAEVQAYLVQWLPNLAATTEVAGLVHRCTEGHPLFMVHVVDDLAHQGVLSKPDPALGSTPLVAAEASVPAALQPLIELQLGRLSPATQQVLEVASVVGVEFAEASVAAGLPTAMDTIPEICEALARRGEFLEVRGLAKWPDGTVSGRYGFRHALYQ